MTESSPTSYASWPAIPEPADLPALARRLAARDPRLARAVALAEQAHAGQLRDGTDVPYVFHPLSVAAIGLEVGLDEVEDLATAVLHDVLEDSALTEADLAAELGPRVAAQVALLTKRKGGGDGYFGRLAGAIAPVRLVKGLDRFHNLLTIPEDRREKYVQETRERILPLLGETPAERHVHRLLTQLAALREAGDRKLALPRASETGRLVEQALTTGMRLDFERLYDLATPRRFERREEKEGQLLFMVAYVVTAGDRVALFERSTLRERGSLTGRGLLAAVTPLPEWPTEVSAFRRLLCAPDAIREILPMGQGVSDAGGARYVFEIFNVVLREPAPVRLLSATDRFAGFVALEEAEAALGQGRELDRDLCRHLAGEAGPLPRFTPSSLRTRIRERLFLGMDIVAFSTLDTYTQVAELLRLHQRLRAELAALPWREPLIFSPTGDGCFLSAHPADLASVLVLAGRLRHGLEQGNVATGRALELRFGLNRGPAFSIQDINGAENLIGDGINLAARMLGGEAPWEMNVWPETMARAGGQEAPPEAYRFVPARLAIKHHAEPVDVLRVITPALPPNRPSEPAAPGRAPTRDGGPPCECLALTDWPRHEDYETTVLGLAPTGGHHAEVSLERCRSCGRTWLRCLQEDEAETSSGRWYRGLITETQAGTISAREGLDLLRGLPFHQWGGSYYGRCGTSDGPAPLGGGQEETVPGGGASPTPGGGAVATIWQLPGGELLVEDREDPVTFFEGQPVKTADGQRLASSYRYHRVGPDGAVRETFGGLIASVEDDLWVQACTVRGAELVRHFSVYDTFEGTERHSEEIALTGLVPAPSSAKQRTWARAALAAHKDAQAVREAVAERKQKALFASFRRALRAQGGASPIRLLLTSEDAEPWPYVVTIAGGAELWRTSAWHYHGADLLHHLERAAAEELGPGKVSFEVDPKLHTSMRWDDR